MDAILKEKADQYISTSKEGDIMGTGPCPNPIGWTTVYRNGLPIHHFPDQKDAEAVALYIHEKGQARFNK